MPLSTAIETRNLHVTFGAGKKSVHALRDLSLSVPKGSLFVLLGPNGAGKTTLVRCVTGLMSPSLGTASVFGGEIASRACLGRIGVLIENPGLYGRLSAGEYLRFFGSFYGVPDLSQRIRTLCEAFGLELDGKPTGKLSQGNRQKLQLVRSLLHSPELLLWDEPTDHLDPVAQREVLGYLVRYLAQTGSTALVATHRLEQMETTGTDFGFLVRGQLVKNGSRDAILGMDQDIARVRIGFSKPVAAAEWEWLEKEFSVRASASMQGGEEAGVDLSGPELGRCLPGLIKAMSLRDLPLRSVTPYRRTLAEVYASVVTENGVDPGHAEPVHAGGRA